MALPTDKPPRPVVAITGATGMIGTALSAALETLGSRVVPVSRHDVAGGIRWDPGSGKLAPAAWNGINTVIHLAGENIGAGRWTAARRRELTESRVGPTALLTRTLAGLERPPSLLISASAIGFYGDRGDEPLTELSGPGEGFLSRLAVAWERAADPARAAGIRVVHPRFGLVLSPVGGMLRRILPPFRLGLGGSLGRGNQWLSWVAIDDLAAALIHLIGQTGVTGPVNIAAPEPVRNTTFTEQLAAALERPAPLRIPAGALRFVLGPLRANELLLTSQRVESTLLARTGFRFAYPELPTALGHLIRHT